MKRKLILTESEMVSLIKKIISEQYEPDKLYPRWYIVDMLNKGPRELRKYVKGLSHIECYDSNDKKHICTKIPEVIYVYLSGRY
jgi:hypothetical protein